MGHYSFSSLAMVLRPFIGQNRPLGLHLFSISSSIEFMFSSIDLTFSSILGSMMALRLGIGQNRPLGLHPFSIAAFSMIMRPFIGQNRPLGLHLFSISSSIDFISSSMDLICSSILASMMSLRLGMGQNNPL